MGRRTRGGHSPPIDVQSERVRASHPCPPCPRWPMPGTVGTPAARSPGAPPGASEAGYRTGYPRASTRGPSARGCLLRARYTLGAPCRARRARWGRAGVRPQGARANPGAEHSHPRADVRAERLRALARDPYAPCGPRGPRVAPQERLQRAKRRSVGGRGEFGGRARYGRTGRRARRARPTRGHGPHESVGGARRARRSERAPSWGARRQVRQRGASRPCRQRAARFRTLRGV